MKKEVSVKVKFHCNDCRALISERYSGEFKINCNICDKIVCSSCSVMIFNNSIFEGTYCKNCHELGKEYIKKYFKMYSDICRKFAYDKHQWKIKRLLEIDLNNLICINFYYTENGSRSLMTLDKRDTDYSIKNIEFIDISNNGEKKISIHTKINNNWKEYIISLDDVCSYSIGLVT